MSRLTIYIHELQVMSAGCIPVIVARDFVKPFAEEVDWSAFSFTFSPDEVPDMLRILRSVPPEELIQMQVRLEQSRAAPWLPHGRTVWFHFSSKYIRSPSVRAPTPKRVNVQRKGDGRKEHVNIVKCNVLTPNSPVSTDHGGRGTTT